MEISKKNLSKLIDVSANKLRNPEGRWKDDTKDIIKEVKLMSLEDLCQNYVEHIVKLGHIYTILKKNDRKLSREEGRYKVYCVNKGEPKRCSVYSNVDKSFINMEYYQEPCVVVTQYSQSDVGVYLKLNRQVILNKLPS